MYFIISIFYVKFLKTGKNLIIEYQTREKLDCPYNKYTNFIHQVHSAPLKLKHEVCNFSRKPFHGQNNRSFGEIS